MDIPLGDLLLGLGCAALIGAAGGIVYGGILGPADKARGRERTARRKTLLGMLPLLVARKRRPHEGAHRIWRRRRGTSTDTSREQDGAKSETP